MTDGPTGSDPISSQQRASLPTNEETPLPRGLTTRLAKTASQDGLPGLGKHCIHACADESLRCALLERPAYTE